MGSIYTVLPAVECWHCCTGMSLSVAIPAMRFVERDMITTLSCPGPSHGDMSPIQDSMEAEVFSGQLMPRAPNLRVTLYG